MKLSLRRAVLRAVRAQRLPKRDGSVFFLPYPLRLAGMALSMSLLFGCASAAKTVATQQVARDFYRNRFEQNCHVQQPPAWCIGYDVKLNRFDRDLDEANSALHWVQTTKAKMPLQLKALNADRKALDTGYKP